jgi:hypothetical protein
MMGGGVVAHEAAVIPAIVIANARINPMGLTRTTFAARAEPFMR